MRWISSLTSKYTGGQKRWFALRFGTGDLRRSMGVDLECAGIVASPERVFSTIYDIRYTIYDIRTLCERVAV